MSLMFERQSSNCFSGTKHQVRERNNKLDVILVHDCWLVGVGNFQLRDWFSRVHIFKLVQNHYLAIWASTLMKMQSNLAGSFYSL